MKPKPLKDWRKEVTDTVLEIIDGKRGAGLKMVKLFDSAISQAREESKEQTIIDIIEGRIQLPQLTGLIDLQTNTKEVKRFEDIGRSWKKTDGKS